jgi:S-adenosylmethionine hydrolase
MHRNIVTLTTDWGIKDFSLAAVKGQMVTFCPDALVVDISHDIQPFNISSAAFVLKNAFPYFPKESWHLIEVGISVESYIVMYYREHYFMGCDNGIFSMLLDKETPDSVYAINTPVASPSPIIDIFIPVLAQLFQGVPIEEITSPASLKHIMPTVPRYTGRTILGHIVYIDHYENLFTNIPRHLFDKVRQSSLWFELGVARSLNKHKISCSQTIWNTRSGDAFSFFVNDFLVIGIKDANASGLLCGEIDDSIEIAFIN